jgi:predicted  nucleic acid-binding Zn-ribbon protein
VAVLLEELRSQMKIVIEAVQECATKTELGALRSEFSGLRSEFTGLRSEFSALGSEFTGLRSEFSTLGSEFTGLRSEFSAFRADVRGGFDAMNGRFDALTAEVARKAEGAALGALERRVTALEHGAGIRRS